MFADDWMFVEATVFLAKCFQLDILVSILSICLGSFGLTCGASYHCSFTYNVTLYVVLWHDFVDGPASLCSLLLNIHVGSILVLLAFHSFRCSFAINMSLLTLVSTVVCLFRPFSALKVGAGLLYVIWMVLSLVISAVVLCLMFHSWWLAPDMLVCCHWRHTRWYVAWC